MWVCVLQRPRGGTRTPDESRCQARRNAFVGFCFVQYRIRRSMPHVTTSHRSETPLSWKHPTAAIRANETARSPFEQQRKDHKHWHLRTYQIGSSRWAFQGAHRRSAEGRRKGRHQQTRAGGALVIVIMKCCGWHGPFLFSGSFFLEFSKFEHLLNVNTWLLHLHNTRTNTSVSVCICMYICIFVHAYLRNLKLVICNRVSCCAPACVRVCVWRGYLGGGGMYICVCVCVCVLSTVLLVGAMEGLPCI